MEMQKTLTWIELEEAVALLQQAPPIQGETLLPLESALGMVLAHDIISSIDQPPFDRSPLDGYALIAADTASAAQNSPVTLSVIAKLCAGDVPLGKPVQSGQAVRIMTGAPIPSGCNCVIRQEDITLYGDTITVKQSLAPNENICFCGEDFKSGDILLASGSTINAAAIGVLASAGLTEVTVRRKLAVALISSGDELVEAGKGKILPPGKIYSSNLPMLRARLGELGISTVSAVHIGDDPEQGANCIREIITSVDAIITTGGVSVGEKDLFNDVFPLLGVRPVFHGITIKPGSPAMFSYYEGKPVLSLSGNPFAAAATFELLARPLLSALAADPSILPIKTFAALASPYSKTSGSRRFVRGKLDEGNITLPEGHSSGQLRSLAGCNCLVEIKPDTAPSQGDLLEVYLL